MSKFKRGRFIILLSVLSLGLLAGCTTPERRVNVGPTIPVKSYKKQADGILFTMMPGKMKVQICTDKIIRVWYTPVSKFPSRPSLMVNRTVWPTVNWEMKETKRDVTLKTSKIEVKVALTSGAITFFDTSGKVLLQESPQGGKKLNCTRVAGESVYHASQSFLNFPDENYYGLGQHQKGYMNYRGTIVKLEQQNTVVAIPFLVTNKGYALLWDNNSTSRFDAGSGLEIIPKSQLYQVDGKSGGLTGEYYNNSNFTCLKLTRIDTTIDFNWSNGSPDRSIQNIFSVRWKGKIKTINKNGYYKFYTESNNEVRLWVNGDLVVDKTVNSPVLDTGKIWLNGNTEYDIMMEYSKNSDNAAGEAVVRLGWVPPNSPAKVVSWWSEVADAIDYYFVYGPGVDEEISGYRDITGQAPMMGKWALGFWQSKNSYRSQTELLDIAEGYRSRNIPVDNIVLDLGYWGKYGWNAMKFDERYFPDPGEMVKDLHDKKFHLMISIWPNFGQGTAIYDEMKNNGYFIGYSIKEGSGKTGWYDPFNAEARKSYWRNINESFFKIGIDAWWLDCTEPASYQIVWHDKNTALGTGARYFNAYSLMDTKGVYEGQRKATSEKRVFILTRSAFAGQQRYSAATWSGDIGVDFPTLKRQIPAGLNFCLSGIPYWTTDIGGYYGRSGVPENPGYQEVFIRWFQYGTFCPIFRVHGNRQGRANELWSYGGKIHQNILTKYDNLRYRLMPYIYSLAWKVTSEGYTMMRALIMDFANDSKTANISDQFMFGPAILVNPVTSAGATSRDVYLPGERLWYDFWTGEVFDGGQTVNVFAPLEKIPLYVRAGSIIPMGPFLQYATEKDPDPIELRVYKGADGQFTLYEDDGTTYEYEKGKYAIIPITWNEGEQTLTIGERQGDFRGMLSKRTFNIVWVSSEHGIGLEETTKADKSVSYDGNAISVSPAPTK